MKKFSALFFVILVTIFAAPVFAAPAPTGWQNDIDAAVKYSNYKQIDVIAASHPEAQGEIAVYLLQQSRSYRNDPEKEVRLFKAATPFVSRINAANVRPASEVIADMTQLASDPTFQSRNPQGAADIYLYALNMSGQPNVVAYDPNLHSEVLEAANDFIKSHPQDSDKKLLDQVSLAQAGGAPETTPRGIINPSAE
jgi:hypothetical protein